MSVDVDNLFAERFAPTRDAYDDSDWNDVLRRQPRRTRRTKRALLVAVLIAAIAVPAGIALAGPIHDLFFSTPAPPPIKQAFDKHNEARRFAQKWARTHGQKAPDFGPQIDASRARGVIAITTPDGPLYLWTAPSKSDGRECWYVNFASDQDKPNGARGQGTCERLDSQPSSNIAWNGLGWSADHPDLKTISGKLYVEAASVLIRFPNMPSKRLPVIDNFFLGAFPRTTKTPTRIDAIDSQGHIVATWQR